MAKTDYKTIDEYINTFPTKAKVTLETVRKTIQQAVPEAEEVISYQIPAFKYHGFVLYFAAYTNHFSISSPPPTFEIFKDELRAYKVSKSVFQVPYDQPIPVDLISKIAKYRASENIKRAKSR